LRKFIYYFSKILSKAENTKKATEKITFICDQGAELEGLIEQMQPGDTRQLLLISTGYNCSDEQVAKFFITWSFKRKH
jgi:hypothetical protein